MTTPETTSEQSPPSALLDIDDLSRGAILDVLDKSAALKASDSREAPLAGQTLAMVFEKPSTRTRVSFEVAMTQLGGHAVFLGQDDIQLGRGEPISDTSRVLSGYADAVMARLFDHGDMEELAAHATAPVINGLTDDAHPCQTLADLMTIRETFGEFDIEAAWVGDGNNVAQSFILGCAVVGIDVRVATPEGYGISESVLERAAALGAEPDVGTDPEKAVAGADVVYTDVWVSMGEEDEREAKLEAFEGFQVNAELLEHAPECNVLHCLPAHRGEEITDEVLSSERSLVFEQAENRLHAQKGLLLELLE